MRFLATLCAAAAAFAPVELLFSEFKANYARKYTTEEEEAHRREVFAKNVAYITKRNSEQGAYKLEINEFADQSHEEFRATRFGVTMPPAPLLGMSVGTHTYSGLSLPEEVDWVVKGAVTDVKNQGQCGSCWSFSTTGALEGAQFLKSGKLTPLSEQNFVDCDATDNGCNGGLMDNAFKFAEGHDICTEESYAYTAAQGQCRQDSCTVGLKRGAVTGFKDVEATEEALMEAVAQQPVAIAIEADQQDFQFYKSGVLTASCGTNLDHGVLLVGYGEEDGKKYWKVKNSWGAEWGDQGFIKLARGVAQEGGQCGLLLKASYPVLGDAAPAAKEEAPANAAVCTACEAVVAAAKLEATSVTTVAALEAKCESLLSAAVCKQVVAQFGTKLVDEIQAVESALDARAVCEKVHACSVSELVI